MSKFKVGDKVRRINDNDKYGIRAGFIGTVSEVSRTGVYLGLKEITSPERYLLFSDNFELVEPASSEESLESLVEQYNTVLAKVCKRVDEIEVSHEGKIWYSLIGSESFRRQLRVKQKPAFEPFFVGTRDIWQVTLDGSKVHIGCKSWDAPYLLDAFKVLSSGTPGKGSEFRPTRAGLNWELYSITWAEVDNIIAALEKAGIK